MGVRKIALKFDCYEHDVSHLTLESMKSIRHGKDLDERTAAKIVNAYINGELPDYVMSAWLATAATAGLSLYSIKSLTKAYINSGDIIDHSELGERVIDKHSTGGVGDKVTFIVVPIVAACGFHVAKISGRGLGHAGGTLDKLESLEGIKANLSKKEFSEVLKKTGMVISGQSGDLVPGDKATYQLRDISGSVESISLIAASIISKKVATGAKCLVLDVKTGPGALIEDYDSTIKLTKIMVELAKNFGINCKAVVSDMNIPLGNAIGNSLEIIEAIEILKGKKVPRLTELCLKIAVMMLQTAKPDLNESTALKLVEDSISSGRAFEKFIEWAESQGVPKGAIEDGSAFLKASISTPIFSNFSGFIAHIDPRLIGNATLNVGAKRSSLTGAVEDHSAGIFLKKHVGDLVEEGEEIAIIYHNQKDISNVVTVVSEAFEILPEKVLPPPIIYTTL